MCLARRRPFVERMIFASICSLKKTISSSGSADGASRASSHCVNVCEREMWGRCGRDVEEMWGRCGGDVGEMWGRCGGDIGDDLRAAEHLEPLARLAAEPCDPTIN